MGTWSTLSLAGKPCHVFEPSAPNPHGQLALYLHDVDGARPGEVFAAELDRHGLYLVGPHSGPSWWTDRVWPPFDDHQSTERFLIDRLVPELAVRWNTKPPQLAILGAGMGGQGALRIAFKHPNLFPVVAAVSPAIDYQDLWKAGDEVVQTLYADPEEVRQDTATLHVHPLNWPRNIWFSCDPQDSQWYESADRLRMKLSAIGIPHEHDLETTARGNVQAYRDQVAPAALQFVAERLQRERLRVPIG